MRHDKITDLCRTTRVRSASLSLVAALIGTACATDLDPAELALDGAEDPRSKADDGASAEDPFDLVEVELQPAKPRPRLDDDGRPVPGTLVFGDESGPVDLSGLVPNEAPREFADEKALALWAHEMLGAELVENPDGGLGARLAADSGDTYFYDPDTDTMRAAASPIAAILGGRFGYVVVGGEKRCVDREAPCAADEIAASEAAGEKSFRAASPNWRSGSQGPFAIVGETWMVHLIFFHHYGAATWQSGSGGLRNEAYRCGPWGWFWCTRTVGSNNLAAGFGAFRFHGSIGNGSSSIARQNTWKVATEHWGVGVPISVGDTPKDWGQPSPYNLAGLVADTDSVCSSHSGSSGPFNVSFMTATGVRPC